MREVPIAILIFFCLLAASLGGRAISERLPSSHRQDDTLNAVRQVASIFVVMTSLVLGLMISSAKNTFEGVDHNVHSLATSLIILDRTLVQFGPETNDTRQRLLDYTKRAANGARHGDPLLAHQASESLLNDVGKSLRAIKPKNPEQLALWEDARHQFQKVFELRWIIVEQSEGTIPVPLLVMLVAWLALIFASFGYRAPRNPVVTGSFVLSSLLVAGAIYLIMDMDVPFSGPIQVSPIPLQRAITELQQ